MFLAQYCPFSEIFRWSTLFVLRPTNSNFNKRGPCTLFFLPKIVSITISCNVSEAKFSERCPIFTRAVGTYANKLIHFSTTPYPETSVHTKHRDFELSSGDTIIKVTVLQLTYMLCNLGLSIVNVYWYRNNDGFLTIFTFWIYIHVHLSGR